MVHIGSVAVGALLFAVALLTRLPFATEHLWAWDSVLYARAMERFDPLEQRPQAPGYLWYVLLARAVASVTLDANAALVLISAVAGALSVALVYVLARRMFDGGTGVIAAAYLLTSVTFWAYGAVAYPYTLLAALVTGVALALWRAWERPGFGALVAASAAWGIAIGFRSDLALFVAPLWLVAAWRAGLLAAAAGAAVIAGFVGAWLGASALASGGLDRFVQATSEQGGYVERTYSVFGRGLDALRTNAYEMARYLVRAEYALMVPLVASVAVLRAMPRAAIAFLVLWVMTPFSVYLLVHVGDYGYVFSFLPALAILAARGTYALTALVRRLVPRASVRGVAVAIAGANALLFLVSDTPLSAADLARRDAGTGQKVAYVRGLGDVRGTILSAYDAVIVEHYLPERRDWVVRIDPAGPRTFVGRGACDQGPPCVVLVWDDILRAEGAWEEVRLASGARLRLHRSTTSVAVAVDGLRVRLQ